MKLKHNHDTEEYLRSIPASDSRYGKALQALARMGSLSWIATLKWSSNKETKKLYDAALKLREEKMDKELAEMHREIYAGIEFE